MKIYIVGNSDVAGDNIPSKLGEILTRTFPDMQVVYADPSENFIPEPTSVIIDSVEGIDRVTWFHDIDAFITTKSVSGHDYDLGFHLKLLMKLRKISTVTILGVPRVGMMSTICEAVIRMLNDKANTTKADL
jgi:hypothetical protein